MSIINFITRAVMASLILVGILVSAEFVQANPTDEQKKIIGVWQLKTIAPNKKSKQIKPEFFPVPIEFAPESLVLAADEELNEITINEGFTTMINTQTLPTDGTTVTKNVDLIGTVSSSARWSNNKLVVEMAASNGLKMSETFELSPNQKQLIVTVKASGNRTGKITKMRRVYDRAATQTEDQTAQVGITVYPF